MAAFCSPSARTAAAAAAAAAAHLRLVLLCRILLAIRSRRLALALTLTLSLGLALSFALALSLAGRLSLLCRRRLLCRICGKTGTAVGSLDSRGRACTTQSSVHSPAGSSLQAVRRQGRRVHTLWRRVGLRCLLASLLRRRLLLLALGLRHRLLCSVEKMVLRGGDAAHLAHAARLGSPCSAAPQPLFAACSMEQAIAGANSRAARRRGGWS
jgi:hypothetical protein